MIAALAPAAIVCAKLTIMLGVLATATHSASAGRATLNLVLVLDGLRPDAITPEQTPNLWRLRREGVNFPNSHAVFPTVTRVNATAVSTGTYPDRNGILGNRIYVRAVDPNFAFVNDDYRNLLRLDEVTGGGMVLVKSLGEILAERGKRLAAVSSGSTGQALLLNPRAPKGSGILINGIGNRACALHSRPKSATPCSSASAPPRPAAARRHRTTLRSPGPNACCATMSCRS
jgi:hypothetical protein